MFHPDLMMALAHDRHRELIVEADRRRVLARARRWRRASAGTAADPEISSAAAARADGTLAPCGQRVAAPAR